MGRDSPCFITAGLSQPPHSVYGLPALEYPGLVKVSGTAVAGDLTAGFSLTSCLPGVLPLWQPY